MTWLRAHLDRSGASALCGLGVILLVVGWFGVSSTTFAAEQIPWVISCGIGGLFCLGVAAVLWLSADLQDEWRKLDALESAVLATQAVERAAASTPEPVVAPAVAPEPITEPISLVPALVPTAAPVRRPRTRTTVKAG